MKRKQRGRWTKAAHQALRMKRTTTPRGQPPGTATTTSNAAGRGPPPTGPGKPGQGAPEQLADYDGGGDDGARSDQDRKGKAKQLADSMGVRQRGGRREGSGNHIRRAGAGDDELDDRLDYGGGTVLGWATAVILAVAVVTWATFVAAYATQASERERSCQVALIEAQAETLRSRCRQDGPVLEASDSHAHAHPDAHIPPAFSAEVAATVAAAATSTAATTATLEPSATPLQAASPFPSLDLRDGGPDPNFRPRWTGFLGTTSLTISSFPDVLTCVVYVVWNRIFPQSNGLGPVPRRALCASGGVRTGADGQAADVEPHHRL